ncbi:MAG: mycofactocin-coupled SDR family oxidoreductase [Flavobacteriaceae bacterium]|jgi:NAD(P)-dependent dehydrogenase (short-subunit alcohol dehydrogenase family)|nr:mycofactocin-coupled SDR family oxidoreductase [Flavobacteriaceae bacterium]
MAKEFKEKTIFITGAANGQGRAAALAFAKEGANIIGFDLGKKIEYPSYNNGGSEQLESLKQEIESIGGRFVGATGDVRNYDDILQAVDLGVEQFGTIDILFNNAGISAYGYAHELTENEWDSMVDINLKGAFLVAKAVIPFMIRQQGGVIINNSSVAGLRGMKRLSHYAASKWGLVGLTKSWAIELAPHNIRVISIHPTGVNTPMNDGLAEMEGTTALEIAERSAGNLLKTPWVETEDVVNALLYLASDKARYVTGSQFILDAGLLTA